MCVDIFQNILDPKNVTWYFLDIPELMSALQAKLPSIVEGDGGRKSCSVWIETSDPKIGFLTVILRMTIDFCGRTQFSWFYTSILFASVLNLFSGQSLDCCWNPKNHWWLHLQCKWNPKRRKKCLCFSWFNWWFNAWSLSTFLGWLMVNFHQVPEIMEEELQEAKRDTLFWLGPWGYGDGSIYVWIGDTPQIARFFWWILSSYVHSCGEIVVVLLLKSTNLHSFFGSVPNVSNKPGYVHNSELMVRLI